MKGRGSSMKLTRKDIAKEAGVSPSTVSRALTGSPLIPPETTAKIRELAGRMGYKPNALAKQLAFNRSFQLGFVLPLNLKLAHKSPLRMSYYSNILNGMVGTAFERGYRVCLHPYAGEGKDAGDALAEAVEKRNVDGLVLLGLSQRSRIPASLIESNAPFVLIGSRQKGASSVNCNPLPALKAFISRIAELGYERLIHVQGDSRYYDAATQNASLKAAAKGSRFESFETMPGDYSKTSGHNAAEELFARRRRFEAKTCVFLACDRMAMGFYNYCHERGIGIPTDVGVFGSDGDELASALHPKLASMIQPRESMGSLAASILMDICEGKRHDAQDEMLEGTPEFGDSLN